MSGWYIDKKKRGRKTPRPPINSAPKQQATRVKTTAAPGIKKRKITPPASGSGGSGGAGKPGRPRKQEQPKPPTTLLDFIQKDFEKISEEVSQLDHKKAEIEAVRAEIQQCGTKRTHIRRKRELEDRLVDLGKQVEELKKEKPKEEYEKRVRGFFQEYQRQRDLYLVEDLAGANGMGAAVDDSPVGNFVIDQEGKATKRSRTAGVSEDILADYAKNMQGKGPAIKVMQDDICENCGDVMLLVQHSGIMSCRSCGASCRYMDTTSAAIGYGEDVEYTSFSYQRVNHFNEWLTYLQAKENTRVPEHVIHVVMNDLRTRNLTEPTIRHVGETLHRLKLRQFYKQQTQIWCTITGHPPPRLNVKQEEQFRLMFKAIQAPFEKCKPESRRNFFSYPYILFQFSRLLGYNELLKYFSLLKGAEKLHQQDLIWDLVCKELDWDFIPST